MASEGGKPESGGETAKPILSQTERIKLLCQKLLPKFLYTELAGFRALMMGRLSDDPNGESLGCVFDTRMRRTAETFPVPGLPELVEHLLFSYTFGEEIPMIIVVPGRPGPRIEYIFIGRPRLSPEAIAAAIALAIAPGTPVVAPGTPAVAPGTPAVAPGTPVVAPGTSTRVTSTPFAPLSAILAALAALPVDSAAAHGMPAAAHGTTPAAPAGASMTPLAAARGAPAAARGAPAAARGAPAAARGAPAAARGAPAAVRGALAAARGAPAAARGAPAAARGAPAAARGAPAAARGAPAAARERAMSPPGETWEAAYIETKTAPTVEGMDDFIDSILASDDRDEKDDKGHAV
jgi:hypothetical protein